jgi:hypothetical protein
VLEILAGFSAAETSGSIFWMTSQIPPLIYSRYMSFMSVANSDFRPPDFGAVSFTAAMENLDQVAEVSSQFLKSWTGPSKIRHIWDI